MYESSDMRANSDRGYEMQLDRLLYSANYEQIDKSSSNKKDISSTIEVIEVNKTATVKYWKNIKPEY